MRRPPSRPPRDPDFDRQPPVGPGPSREDVRYFQRLVVNPFLSVLAGAAGLLAVGAVDRARADNLFGPTVLIGLAVAYVSLQYHCLDCGATGSYRRWRRHACPRVWDRRAGLLPSGPGFPPAPTQVILWILWLLAAGMIVSFAMRR